MQQRLKKPWLSGWQNSNFLLFRISYLQLFTKAEAEILSHECIFCPVLNSGLYFMKPVMNRCQETIALMFVSFECWHLLSSAVCWRLIILCGTGTESCFGYVVSRFTHILRRLYCSPIELAGIHLKNILFSLLPYFMWYQ